MDSVPNCLYRKQKRDRICIRSLVNLRTKQLYYSNLKNFCEPVG